MSLRPAVPIAIIPLLLGGSTKAPFAMVEIYHIPLFAKTAATTSSINRRVTHRAAAVICTTTAAFSRIPQRLRVTLSIVNLCLLRQHLNKMFKWRPNRRIIGPTDLHQLSEWAWAI
jgi:hypothetical protein